MFRIAVPIWLVVSYLLCGSQRAIAATLPGTQHVLKDRVIRALAVEPGDAAHILVGQKTGKPGSALVFQSLDQGRTWRTLNNNRPLSPDASDVQAVAAFSKRILLAGTWKFGLFISHDGGQHFMPVPAFPSQDIRDIQIAGGIIYAATADRGVFESNDRGKTWQETGPSNDFLWSLAYGQDRLSASSPDKGVFVRHNEGWRILFNRDKAYASAHSPGGHAVAGETGLYISSKAGWRKYFAGEKFADVVYAGQDQILAASWSNGIVVLRDKAIAPTRLLDGQTVIHLQITGDRLLVGTWGDGLYNLTLRDALN